jgi:hypothetical protein
VAKLSEPDPQLLAQLPAAQHVTQQVPVPTQSACAEIAPRNKTEKISNVASLKGVIWFSKRDHVK